jgi:phosphoglycerate dehydrogenase-like enzyme
MIRLDSNKNMINSRRLTKTKAIKFLVSLSLPDFHLKKIEAVSSNVEVLQSQDKKELLTLVQDADILFAGIFSREMFLAANKLKWIQTLWAGVERFLYPEVVNSHVIITNAGGIHPTPVSEHAVGFMLCFSRKLHFFIRNQVERKWKESDEELLLQFEELPGKTVGIVGLGKIGTAVAEKSKCLGMRVIATRRNLSSPKPDYVDKMVYPENLKELLAESDFVVITLPLTKETDGIIGEAQLRSMKSTGYLINVSRGKVVQENKLIQALKEGWIAGAGLDTFENEPLPNDSALWGMDNVIITPHVAGLTPYYMERLINILTENLKRFINGENLINVIDKTLGY